jgi:hypothetical protein
LHARTPTAFQECRHVLVQQILISSGHRDKYCVFDEMLPLSSEKPIHLGAALSTSVERVVLNALAMECGSAA